MARITRGDLDNLARLITRQLDGDEHEIGYAYGSPRLHRAGGAVDVSPRLPAGELALWMRAYSEGIIAANRREGRRYAARNRQPETPGMRDGTIADVCGQCRHHITAHAYGGDECGERQCECGRFAVIRLREVARS